MNEEELVRRNNRIKEMAAKTVDGLEGSSQREFPDSAIAEMYNIPASEVRSIVSE